MKIIISIKIWIKFSKSFKNKLKKTEFQVEEMKTFSDRKSS